MSVRVNFSANVWDKLRDHHLAGGKCTESISYCFANADVVNGDITINLDDRSELIFFAPDCYARQTHGGITVYADVKTGVLIRFMQSSYDVLVNIHDHWFTDHPVFSSIDDHDDLTFDRELRSKLEPNTGTPGFGEQRKIFNLSVVLGQQSIEARLVDGRVKPRFDYADKAVVLAEHWQPVVNTQRLRLSINPDSETYARHSDFITPDHRAVLHNVHVALVGAGGIGSIVGESLGRVGVGNVTIVDDDRLDQSNLNRWQGGSAAMVGMSKSRLLAARLRKMFPHMNVNHVHASLYSNESASALFKADVAFGAVDNDAARFFLNRFSVQYLKPYFDAAVSVETDPVDFLARYFAVLPGITSCASCNDCNLIDEYEASLAFSDRDTMSQLRVAGYVKDNDVSAPSVYMLNQSAASMLLTEFLNFVCAWRPTTTVAYEKWRSGEKRRLDRDVYPNRPGDQCPVCTYYLGAGSTESLPNIKRSNPYFLKQTGGHDHGKEKTRMY